MLRRTRRSFTALVGAALAMGMLPSTAARAAATPTTYAIGVDNASPAGHNYGYDDFFPRSGVNIHTGDVLNYAWNSGSLDNFHTVSLLPAGQTEAQARQAYPSQIPDTDDGPGSTMNNPAADRPTFPPGGSGAPGACGDTATPCGFDGTKFLNSGGMPTNGGPGPGATFAVKVTAPAGTYTAICLIHRGMAQTFTVVADTVPASTASEVSSAAASQYTVDTNEAQAAAAAFQSTSTPNADGTNTVTAAAGVTTSHVEVDEMLPAGLRVKPGDHVTWSGSFPIHTVTFPAGNASSSVDPFNAVCESASGPDTPATGPPPDGGCAGGPPALEQVTDPAPHGPTSIRGGGYRLGAADGGVFDYGHAPYLGSASQFHPAAPIVATVPTSDGQGYWQVGSDGGIFTFGDAPFLGSAATAPKTAPIVSMIASPSDDGYALIGADGKLYPFGSVPPQIANVLPKLAAPAVGGVVAGNNGPGALIAAADGGVFNIGAAPFFGSAGNIHLAKPVVGIAATPDGGGYWLVASDGGIFTYGDAGFFGSLGATHLNAPVVGITPSASGNGYQLVAADGGVFDFGDAVFLGSAGNLKLASPVNSIGTVPSTVGSSGIISGQGGPFPTSYTFSFPEKGTFTYQCRIHDHMRGVISST
ncbi:MAG: hypothetical protein NVSMB12_09840 [Acidimicrobiales bacterium]